jgi:murein DD-endopeptidase MepM/ murein hydrolase activator NlpD
VVTEQLRTWRQLRFAGPAIGAGVATLFTLSAASISGASATSPLRTAATIAKAPPPVAASLAEPLFHDTGLRRFRGAVGADLSESLRRAGVPDGAARDYVRQMLRVERFASEISVEDRFDLIVTSIPYEPALLVYAGLDRVGRGDLMLLKYGDDRGRVEWVDARGLDRRETGGFDLPVGGRLTSGYGTRMHPLLGHARFHRGIDLAAAAGTPVRAAAAGEVVRTGWRGGYGRQVVLAHGQGLATSYAHLSRIAARVGERVTRGQVIGFVGSSGLSTGPHVHFEVARNGRAIDPRSARIDAPLAMDQAQRAAFNGRLRFVLMAGGV